MMAAGAFFGIGTAMVAAAFHVAMLVAGRIVLGLGVGLATQATPLYLSEMAPHNIRGALNIMFQLAVTIGIFSAQLINYGTKDVAGYGWRISLAMGGVPALLLFFGAMILPDTPNSLVARGKAEEGRAVLERIRGTENVNVEYDDICTAIECNHTSQSPYRTIIKRRFWPQLTITILIPFFQQFSGINAVVSSRGRIVLRLSRETCFSARWLCRNLLTTCFFLSAQMFYSPQMFEAAGQGSDDALLNTVIMGSVNVFCTIIAILLVDRVGRKFLFIEGGGQMLACLCVVAALIKTTNEQPDNAHIAAAVVAFICIYVAGFAWSWGPLAWLVPTEVANSETRAAGMGIATCSNFLFTFLISQCFLSMLCAMTWGVFLFFGGFMVIMTLFVILLVPETKGVPVEEVYRFVNDHWFWRKVVSADSNDASLGPREDSASAAVGRVSKVGVEVEKSVV
jgi:MFS transporter, SP family, sugar:H+ symporter